MRELKHNDFVIGFPEEWEDASVVILKGLARGGICPNIAITRETLEAAAGLEEYAADQLGQLQEEFAEQDYLVKMEGLTTVGDVPAFQRFHSFSTQGDAIQLQQWQLYVIIGTQAITITCTDRAETFNNSYKLFQTAVNQFRALEPQ